MIRPNQRIGALVLLGALVVAHGCSEDSPTPTPVAPESTAPPVRVLALGDSYTAGEGVAARDGWPRQLVDNLAGAGIEVDELRVIAQTGWTTTDLIDTLAAWDDPDGPWTIVTLLIGVNNQFGGMPAGRYGPEFDSLLTTATALSGNDPGGVIVISLPDYGATPTGGLFGAEEIAREIDAYNAVNLALALRWGARYVDITEISRRARDERGLVARDGLHPSAKMYALWVEVVAPVAQNVIAPVARDGNVSYNGLPQRQLNPPCKERAKP